MHSNNTAIHNGARPNALNMANAVETNKSRNGRYTNSMDRTLSEASSGRKVLCKSMDLFGTMRKLDLFTITRRSR
jgi:hypothetical protein